MLYELGLHAAAYWGPLRLLSSHLVLISIGSVAAGWLAWFWLPRLWNYLPRDRGRAFTETGTAARGKPTGAGLILFGLCLPVCLLVLPATPGLLGALVCLLAAMLFGFLDDASKTPWGEWRKGLLDLLVALGAALAVCEGRATTVWLPFIKQSFVLAPLPFVLLGAPIVWLAMNSTNCSDGVDGLAGILTLLSLAALGIFLYAVVGHTGLANYLLIPHNPNGARWAVLAFVFIGGLAGYLWHNAAPSKVLMGDAGSRCLGLLVGLTVLASGNPFLFIAMAPIVLVNGGTGLVKLILLRGCARLGIKPTAASATTSGTAKPERRPLMLYLLHRYRFPLHDHFRAHGWSDAQILLRFILLQLFLSPLLLAILVKVR